MFAIVCGWALAGPNAAKAVTARIYTLPFFDSYIISCGFGCYSGHEGTDYQLGVISAGGEKVAAALGGTARPCVDTSFPGAGNYNVVDHGGGDQTRYLHLSSQAVSAGQIVGRGDVIGAEGNTGVQDGSYHLHFETRVGAH